MDRRLYSDFAGNNIQPGGNGAVAIEDEQTEANSADMLADLVRQASMEDLYVQVTGNDLAVGKQICPFHDDHSPSLQIYGGEQNHKNGAPHLHCFSCEAHGDAAYLIRRYASEYDGLNLSDSEIISKLLDYRSTSRPAGRNQRSGTSFQKSSFERINADEPPTVGIGEGWTKDAKHYNLSPEIVSEAVGEAHSYWHNELINSNKYEAKRAREFLEARNIKREAWETFNLGFVPPRDKESNLDLWSHLVKRGYGAEVQWAAGLLGRDETSGRYYRHYTGDFGTGDKHKFSRVDYGRIMFPIHDLSGNPIGGAARLPLTGYLLAESKRGHEQSNGNTVPARPKFTNGRNTIIYKNNEIVFNYHRVRQSTSKSWLMVEGYPDALTLHMKGFRNVVSAIGTKISESQLNAVWSHTDKPLICLDGDRAGRLLSVKRAENIERLLVEGRVPAGKTAYFVLLPSGEDPDELARNDKFGPLKMAIERPVPLSTLLDVVRAVPQVRKEQVARNSSESERKRVIEQNKEWKKEYDDRVIAALDQLAACCVDYSMSVPSGCVRMPQLPEGIELTKHVTDPITRPARKRSLADDDGQQAAKRIKVNQGGTRQVEDQHKVYGDTKLAEYVGAKADSRRILIAMVIKLDRAMSFETNLYADGASCEKAHAEFVNSTLAGLRMCCHEERTAVEQFATAASAQLPLFSKHAIDAANTLRAKLEFDLNAELIKLASKYKYPRSDNPSSSRQPLRAGVNRNGNSLLDELPLKQSLSADIDCWLKSHSQVRARSFAYLLRFERKMCENEASIICHNSVPIISVAPSRKYLQVVREAHDTLRTHEREARLSVPMVTAGLGVPDPHIVSVGEVALNNRVRSRSNTR